MKTITLTLSHAYKEMRERSKKPAEGKEPPSFGSGGLSLTAIGLLFEDVHQEKSPEDLMVLRVNELVRSLAMSAAVVTAIVMTPTAVAMGRAAIVAVTVTGPATRGGVNHRSVRRRSVHHARRAIRHHRRAVNDGRQTTRGSDHDGRREDDRRPEGDAHRPTRLRRGGEPSDRNHCYQTEEMFCSHARFDGVFRRFFNELKQGQIAVFKSVRDKEVENE